MFYKIHDYEPLTIPKLIQVEPLDEERLKKEMKLIKAKHFDLGDDDLFYLMINGKHVHRCVEWKGKNIVEDPIVITTSVFMGILGTLKQFEFGGEFPWMIRNFIYSGFMGQQLEGMAPYMAKFIEWTNDPGIIRMGCNDGKTRLIPSFAIVQTLAEILFPPQTYENGKQVFGRASSSV